MPITKPSRLNIFNQFIKADPANKEIYEKLLDDSNTTGAQTAEAMFLARNDLSRGHTTMEQEKATLAQERAALTAWKSSQEQHIQGLLAQSQSQVSQAQVMAKIAADKLLAAETKAASGEPLYREDFAVDSSLRAFAATAPQHSQPQTQGYSPAIPNNYSNPSGAFTPTPQPQQQPSRNAPEVTPEQFIARIIDEIGDLDGLKYDHQTLYNEPLNTKALIAMARRDNKGLLEVYNETYNPDIKRAEVQKAQFDAQVTAAVDLKLKEFAAQGDPSGRASSLAALGMLKGQDSDRSIALASSGPEWTAARQDPMFAARHGLQSQQQYAQQPSPVDPNIPALPQLPPPPGNFMDKFGDWEADMIAGAMEGRGNDAKYKLM